MPREMKYETAMRQLETIAEKMENGELDIDSLCEQLKTAQKLIKMCKDKLTSTEENIKKVLEENWDVLSFELVESILPIQNSKHPNSKFGRCRPLFFRYFHNLCRCLLLVAAVDNCHHCLGKIDEGKTCY